MNILVTGASGFIGRNLVAELGNRGYENIFKITRETAPEDFERYVKECDFVFHLAGINRPKDDKEFMKGNFGFTSQLLDMLKKHNNKAPFLFTSSIQAKLDNKYGKSKKAGEDLLFDYSQETGAKVIIYRLSNLFGKWSKPNYNSVVATFCHNIARYLEIRVDDPDVELQLSYIDDVLDQFIEALEGRGEKDGKFYKVGKVYKIKLGQLAELIQSFRSSREDLFVPNMGNQLTKKLYSTYLSYLPEDDFSYKLKMNKDERGSFTEFLKSKERGQVSVNVSKPGITKGNHWHHTKNEKFLVVSGKGLIQFRDINSEKIIEYEVSGEELEVVDIPTGYTHNIINIGNEDLVTVMWANETFDPDNPDTYFLEV